VVVPRGGYRVYVYADWAAVVDALVRNVISFTHRDGYSGKLPDIWVERQLYQYRVLDEGRWGYTSTSPSLLAPKIYDTG
jgi:hypothetical protein